ncbi:hypothetical protein KHQ06_36935 [Nocardia tengchongensis]|uniref:Uncharacterized protein n=1 Tax=Nocardia tengchongensis TaxID=2055889 RepID=A0ABX8CNI1_9NOCA|nr:hypothetical protein [Nocardia tengchongensis]QVI21470.1 hypothetical protein KHQ06_36935 [Nocardia tengchongensis]
MLREADPTHAAVAQEATWLAIRFRHAACLLLTVVHLIGGAAEPGAGRAVTVLLAVWVRGPAVGAPAGARVDRGRCPRWWPSISR